MPFLTQDPFLKISYFLFPRVKLVRKLYSWISDKLVYILRFTYLLFIPYPPPSFSFLFTFVNPFKYSPTTSPFNLPPLLSSSPSQAYTTLPLFPPPPRPLILRQLYKPIFCLTSCNPLSRFS